MFENVAADLRLQLPPAVRASCMQSAFRILTTQELQAVLIYRFGHWAQFHCRVPVVRRVLAFIYFFLRKASELLLGASIWPESEIGPGFRIDHCGCLFIKAKMGKNCRVSQQVVIGHIGGFRGGGVPELGDDVYVGAGAKILGEIKVGSGATIGANAVVISDVPPGALAVGVPARIVLRGNGAVGAADRGAATGR